jgi:hypothetical protein
MSSSTIGVQADHQTDYGPGGHRYNDDLLLDGTIRERAKQEHPAVAHVIDWEELRAAFRPVNDTANAAKKRSHVAGFWAITSAFLALVGASSEPLWAHLAEPWPKVIVIASGTLGLLAFVIAGMGLIYGTQKQSWLWHRLHTEQLRQMHFQAFVWQLPAIAASLGSADGRRQYEAARNGWLRTLEDNFTNKDTGRLRNLLDPKEQPPIWQVPGAADHVDPVVPKGIDLAPIFNAYEILRFNEQEGYAEHMLRKENRPRSACEVRKRRSLWGWYPGVALPLLVKRKVLDVVWTAGIAVLVAMHASILVANVTGWQALDAPWPHVVVVLFGLLAIGARTLAEGFALTREIERYEEYRAAVMALKRAFRHAGTDRERVRVMVEMEKTAFEEMRMFLRSNEEATFVM